MQAGLPGVDRLRSTGRFVGRIRVHRPRSCPVTMESVVLKYGTGNLRLAEGPDKSGVVGDLVLVERIKGGVAGVVVVVYSL